MKSVDDFLKCGADRQMAILNSLSAIIRIHTESLSRADERLADAAKAVEREQAQLADERDLLKRVAQAFAEFSQAFAASAMAAGSRQGDSAAIAQTPQGG